MPPTLQPHIVQKIQEYLSQGLSYGQIRKLIQRDHGFTLSYSTVSKYRHSPALRYTGQGIRSDKKEGELNWREMVPALKGMQDLKRKASHSQDRAFIELGDGNRPVALACFSDQHMGSWGADYDSLMRMTDELIETHDLYIALVGDYGQYSIKLRSVLESADNLMPPEMQTQFIDSWFNDIWHKVAFATWDNHAVERQEKQAGESSIKKILSRKVTYFNGIGHVDLKVGGEVYLGAVSHVFRGRSMLNPCHAGQRYMRFEGTDREWTMMGDSHVPGALKYTDGDKTRVAINAGSLQNNSGFGKRYFSLTTHPVYPLIVFHPDKHMMTPFWSVKEWLEFRR
jgi:hypothetical protein